MAVIGDQNSLEPIPVKHRRGQIRSQPLIAESRLIWRNNRVSGASLGYRGKPSSLLQRLVTAARPVTTSRTPTPFTTG